MALASASRSTEKTSLLSLLISFYLFFLSGGIAAYAYLPSWVQDIARFVPNTYAVDALRSTLLYGSTSGILNDILLMVVAAVIGVLIGLPSMKRGLSH